MREQDIEYYSILCRSRTPQSSLMPYYECDHGEHLATLPNIRSIPHDSSASDDSEVESNLIDLSLTSSSQNDDEGKIEKDAVRDDSERKDEREKWMDTIDVVIVLLRSSPLVSI